MNLPITRLQALTEQLEGFLKMTKSPLFNSEANVVVCNKQNRCCTNTDSIFHEILCYENYKIEIDYLPKLYHHPQRLARWIVLLNARRTQHISE